MGSRLEKEKEREILHIQALGLFSIGKWLKDLP